MPYIKLSTTKKKTSLNGDEFIVGLDGKNIQISLSVLKNYLQISSSGAILPQKVPGFDLGAPEDPKLYIGGKGDYTLDGVIRTFNEEINFFFWDTNTWSYLEVDLNMEQYLQKTDIGYSDPEPVAQLNLFNKDTQVKEGYRLSSSGGADVVSSASLCTLPIKIPPSTLIRVLKTWSGAPTAFYFLTAAGTYIAGSYNDTYMPNAPGGDLVVSPANARFIRFTIASTLIAWQPNKNGFMVYFGTPEVTYKPFVPFGKVRSILGHDIDFVTVVNDFTTGGALNAASAESVKILIGMVNKRSFFPYDSALLPERATPFINAVKDLIIINPKSDKFYSLTNVNVTGGSWFLRVHEGGASDGTGAVAVINQAIVAGDSGIKTYEGTLGTTTIKIMVDVDVIKTISVTTSNLWANNYPLAKTALAGIGTGIIKEITDISGLRGATYNNFPYKSYADYSNAMIAQKAIKDLTIRNPIGGKFYSLTNIIIGGTGTMTVRVHEANDNIGAGATALINKTFQITESGVQLIRSTGSNPLVYALVDVDYLKTLPFGFTMTNWAKDYPLADSILLDTGMGLIKATPELSVIKLEPKGYPFFDDADGAVVTDFEPISKNRNAFLEYNSTANNSRATSIAQKVIDKDGYLDLNMSWHCDPDKLVENQTITKYMTGLLFPVLPNVPSMIALDDSFKYRERVSLDYVHPEIIDTGADAIGGFRYWLTASNHPDGNGFIEDECVFVSNDFITWKRVRSNTEVYDSSIHAATIHLPPHNLVDPGVNTYDMFLPVPQAGEVVVDAGEVKVVESWLKHDPVMTYDYDEKAIYWILTYHIKFVGDVATRAADANQWSVCIRTKDGLVYDVVRQDGTYYPIATAADSRLMFTQTGGKNNYLRHRTWPIPIPYQYAMLGNSVVKHGGLWYWFYGINGTVVYTGAKIYSVDFDAGQLTTNSEDSNHPSHFSYGGVIYRWGASGLKVYDTVTRAFTDTPINPFFRGYQADKQEYKKCFFVNADGEAVWAVASYMWSFVDFTKMTGSHTSKRASPITIGKCINVADLISAATTLRRSYYFSVEIYHSTSERVELYRVPLITRTGAFEFYNNSIITALKVKKGDRLTVSVTLITTGDVNLALASDIIVRSKLGV